jgi:LPXTG-motif cell wall-anchored protein
MYGNTGGPLAGGGLIGSLAVTGTGDVSWLIAIGVAAVLIGGLLMLRTRRMRRANSEA